MSLMIKEGQEFKAVLSPSYNYLFNKITGAFARWGATKEEDPIKAPAPEILDLEISYGGRCAGNCEFCYKGNGGDQPVHNMTLDEFKVVFNKMPRTLTQIAFGIMNINTNPDFFAMMQHAKDRGVIPNYTCHGFDVTDEVAARTASLCGAVAVSVYSKEHSYNAIKLFTDAGMRQVNIHFMLSEETYDRAFEIVNDAASDPRLEHLNAIVFLAYKPKGRNAGEFTTIKSVEKMRKLIQHCKDLSVSYGCDSCSAPLILKSYQGTKEYDRVAPMIEPCEASCFSSYINADGEFFPCSFTEGEAGWETGLSVLHCNDFIKDIWNHERTLEFQSRLLGSTKGCQGCPSQPICRTCPTFDLKGC